MHLFAGEIPSQHLQLVVKHRSHLLGYCLAYEEIVLLPRIANYLNHSTILFFPIPQWVIWKVNAMANRVPKMN